MNQTLIATPATAANPPLTWNADRAFYLFCLVHLAIWTIIPSLMYHNPPQDTLEGITWGNMWLLGYDKHPFLAPWLSALFTNLFGVVGWPVYFLSQLAVIVSFWAVWRLAKTLLDPWPAFLAVAVLEGIHYYHFSAIPFNPNVAMLPCWALASLTFYRALRDQTLGHWMLASLCAGLSLLAKYESGVLLACLFGLLASTDEGRGSFKKPGIYLGILAAILVFSPHLIWLFKNGFSPIWYALDSMELKGNPAMVEKTTLLQRLQSPIFFLLDQAGTVLPSLLLFLGFFGWERRELTVSRFDRVFIRWLAFGPVLITALIGLVTGSNLVSRWAFPFFSFTGVALSLYFKPEISAKRVQAFLATLLGCTFMLGLGMYGMIFVRPFYTGKAPYTITYPSPEITEWITQAWRQRYHKPLSYVAGDRWLVSSICAFAPDKPKPYFQWIPRQNPWIVNSELWREGAVMVHEIRPDMPNEFLYANLRQVFPGLQETFMVFQHHSQAKLPPVNLWIGFFPPQTLSDAK